MNIHHPNRVSIVPSFDPDGRKDPNQGNKNRRYNHARCVGLLADRREKQGNYRP